MNILEMIEKETIYRKTLPSGMEVFYMPKKGFTKKYAVFATNFGSNDLEFISPHTGERVRLNEGIAHFLEHKMFEQEDGSSAFDVFAKLGASENAATTFDKTSYLFSATENFYEALEHLISYVQSPYFTKENVEKEKGIIAQEIKMYEDDPDWKLFFNALGAMYSKHPVHIDIAGTVESIYRITPEELYLCYNTFYSPSNMALFVIGDLSWEKIQDIVEKTVKDDNAFEGELKRIEPVEPVEVRTKKVTQEFPVSIPMFMIGIKEEAGRDRNGREMLRKMITTDLLMSILFQKGSKLHEELYREGLIFSPLSAEFNIAPSYSYSLISGESRKVDEVVGRIRQRIEEVKAEGLDQEEFERAKKAKIGRFVRFFDSMEGLANTYLSYHFQGMDLMDYARLLEEVTRRECERRLREHFREEATVLSLIEPKAK